LVAGGPPAGEPVDVVEAEVAVGVAGDAARRPRLDEALEVPERGLGPVTKPVERRAAERRADLGLRLVDVLAGVGGDRREGTAGCDLGRRLGRVVEPRA